MRVALIRQNVHEAHGEHSPPRWIALNDALHPVLVVRSLVQHNQNLAFLELELIVIIGITVVKGATSL